MIMHKPSNTNETNFINFLEKFIKDVEAYKVKEGISDDDFCLIVYDMDYFNMKKSVKFIYKNIEEFNKRALKDIRKLNDLTASVEFLMWIFD